MPAFPRRRRRRRKRPRSAFRQEILNLPNMLTMARIAAVPLVMWLMHRSNELVHGAWDARVAAFAAAGVFFAASVTDFLDGWLARRLNLQSVTGRFLDPLADKLLVMACLIELVYLDRVPAWLVALLLSRELGITGLRAIATEEGITLASDRFGKWKTAMQLSGLGGLLLHFSFETDFLLHSAPIDYHRVGLALLTGSMVFSLISAFGYMANFIRGAFGLRASQQGTSAEYI